MSNPLFGNSDEDSSDASSLADGENPLLDSESEDEPDAADTAGASPGGKKKDKKTKGGGALSLLDVVMAGIDIPITAVHGARAGARAGGRHSAAPADAGPDGRPGHDDEEAQDGAERQEEGHGRRAEGTSMSRALQPTATCHCIMQTPNLGWLAVARHAD